MTRGRDRVLVAGFGAVVLLLTACGGPGGTSTSTGSTGTSSTGGRGSGMSEESAAGEKIGDGELRTDLEPLTERFPALGTPTGAEWMGGTLGDAPGPSTYWIDAVVELDPAVADELRATYAPVEVSTPPDVVSAIEERIPDGTWLSSDELDAAVSGSGYSTDVYLERTGSFVVLTAIGSSG
ncbi:hypothetical protein [Promicromonospora sp. NPDC057488]|uniref:hypothetical protein n=1 Tax=Promicromonospora sp. NPDC057488 TaxID=3346147 RepID=UPI0036704C57